MAPTQWRMSSGHRTHCFVTSLEVSLIRGPTAILAVPERKRERASDRNMDSGQACRDFWVGAISAGSVSAGSGDFGQGRVFGQATKGALRRSLVRVVFSQATRQEAPLARNMAILTAFTFTRSRPSLVPSEPSENRAHQKRDFGAPIRGYALSDTRR
jgi:hypothetical protein